KKAWLNPFKFCISNKVKEVYFKILHNIHPCNSWVARFSDKDPLCTFCKNQDEFLIRLFYSCEFSVKFWSDLEDLLVYKGCNVELSGKNVIAYFDDSLPFKNMVNLVVLLGKYHIHKSKFLNSLPKLNSSFFS
ncbi:hypothetical protein LDENG_00122010, partial [Lucifuga dentata]